MASSTSKHRRSGLRQPALRFGTFLKLLREYDPQLAAKAEALVGLRLTAYPPQKEQAWDAEDLAWVALRNGIDEMTTRYERIIERAKIAERELATVEKESS